MKQPTFLALQIAVDIHLRRRQYDQAIEKAENAVAMTPNDPGSQLTMAHALNMAGRPSEAIDFAYRAMRVDPSSVTLSLGHKTYIKFDEKKIEWG